MRGPLVYNEKTRVSIEVSTSSVASLQCRQ